MNEKELYQAAMQATTDGRKEEAIRIFTKLIDIFPGSPEAETARAIRYELKEGNDDGHNFSSTPASGNTPVVSVMFFVLAALSALGAIILASEFWPGDPGNGYQWKAEAYTLSIAWLTLGIVEAAVFTAIGQGLSYLHKIVINTSKNGD